jgi:hypothetical protein
MCSCAQETEATRTIAATTSGRMDPSPPRHDQKFLLTTPVETAVSCSCVAI